MLRAMQFDDALLEVLIQNLVQRLKQFWPIGSCKMVSWIWLVCGIGFGLRGDRSEDLLYRRLNSISR